MLQFTRKAQIRPGRIPLAIEFSLELVPLLNGLTDAEYRCYTVDAGQPLGSMLWTARFDSLAEADAARNTINANDTYWKMVGRVQDVFEPGGEDGFYELVHHAGDISPSQHIVITEAAASPGCLVKAMTWGAEITDYSSNVSGLPGLFYRSLFGVYGMCTWATIADSPEALDDQRAKLTADPGYIDRIDQAGADGLFQPTTAATSMWRRLV